MTSFWIKGEDGEEYGPVELDELRDWLRENRVGLDTSVRRDQPNGTWETWQKFPELVVLLAERRAASPFRGPILFLPAAYTARIAAYIVDSLILAGAAVLLISILNPFLPEIYQVDPATFPQSLLNNSALTLAQTLFLLGVLLTRLAYYTYFHGRTGQTPGKRLFGVRVVGLQGLTISYRQAFFRALSAIFSEMPYFAGYLIVFFTPYRRAFHDLLAGTCVIQVKSGKMIGLQDRL